MNTDYRPDPLIAQEDHHDQTEFSSSYDSDASASVDFVQEEVMGGLSGFIADTNNEEQCNDPGQIVEGHRNIRPNQSIENIVINADSLNEGSVVEDSRNVIQSLMSSIAAPVIDDQQEKYNNPKSINAEVKLAHDEYKRRFQGRPTTTSSDIYTMDPEPCTGKFIVTKVRGWRAGYARILSLHKTYFTTLDPETHEITNLWYYAQVRNYMALVQEEDCMLIDVLENNKSSIKLKFKCAPKNRNEALTSFIQHVYRYETASSMVLNSGNRHPTFERCQRLTRHRTRIDSSLMCAPHGLVELHPTTGSELRTYLYRHIRALSFFSDDTNGIVFYVNETNNSIKSVKCECKAWFVLSSQIGGSGRSELVTLLKNKFDVLAIPLTVSESVTTHAVMDMKYGRALKSVVGERIGEFPVRKFSLRQQDKSQSTQSEGPRFRSLVLTRKGYILEYDKSGNAASCRPLNDVMNIVRHSQTSDQFTIEFKGGIQRRYASIQRETVIVSILDATVYMCKNFDVTVTDVVSKGYKMLSCIEEDEMRDSATSVAQNLFQMDPIETQCIKIVYEVCTVTSAYIQYLCFVKGSNLIPQHATNECLGATEVCREFNANVYIQSLCNLPDEKKLIEGTIRALWGLCSTLLKYINGCSKQAPSGSTYTAAVQDIYAAIVPMFQTLYRLMMTEIGYSFTAIIKEMTGALNEIWMIQDSFGLYWALKCVSALLLPRPFTKERDNLAELHNKGILITPKTSVAVNLVRCMVGNTKISENIGSDHGELSAICSDLVSMVASNIIESILCSHHDTSTTIQVASFIGEISKEYVGVMALLKSSASVLAENASLLVRIIAARSPKTANAIRESALTSGVLLGHFYQSIFSVSEGQRHLSRYLCSLWMSGAGGAEQLLLKRIIPLGFVPYLSMPKLGKEEEDELDLLECGEVDMNEDCSDSKAMSSCTGTNINRFRARVRIVESMPAESKTLQAFNFRIFFHVLGQDHSLPDLVWNKDTRMDMKDALEAELKSIDAEIELRDGITNIAWNHEQFSVKYPSLEKEVRVGSIYMRLWLQASDSFIKTWDDPARLFELIFRRLLIDFDQNATVANMCISCLERLYSAHARKIGAFPDVTILLKYIRRTTSKETKHRLLSLIAVILGVNADEYDPVSIRENAEQLMNTECIHHFCDLASQCHFDANLSISSPLYPDIPEGDVGTSRIEENLLGVTIYSPTKVSLVALRCLERLVSVHKSTDSRGVSYFPIPIVKRLMCENSTPITFDSNVHSGALPILCQCILSNNEEVVIASSTLIRLLTTHNEKASRKLYLTGVFYFACANSSSDWQSLADLIHATHLKQAFISSTESFVDRLQLPPEPQSILGDMIPEGLLKVLMNHGPQKFARVFVGNHDTPEVIWSPAMRQNLISMLLEHLDHFTQMLREDSTLNYEYCPVPKVNYRSLDKELFCHNYYLNNLCDEDRFPNWPIHEPSSVFLSCIKRWREIMSNTHSKEILSLKDAKILFNLKCGADEIELRQAYRALVKKNLQLPDSGKIYHNIQAAYETLLIDMQSSSNDDEFILTDTEGLNLARSQMFPTLLLMKAQILIYKRHSDEIGKYKYPAYSIILSCLQLPSENNLHSTLKSLGRAKFIRVAIGLLFYSCLVSPLNAEELVSVGGVPVLANLLQCYVFFISSMGREQLIFSKEVVSLHMESLVHIVHTIAGISYYEVGRSAIADLPESINFYKNWKHCIDLQFIGGPILGCNLLKRFALEGLVSMTKNYQLQAGLSRTGIMWNLVQCCLDFDPSLELVSLDTENFEISISQQELNYYGGMAARALGMLCGIMKGDYASPSNEPLFDAMKHVLTPPIARMLSSDNSAETLRTLNLNVETPMILWDVKMRGELLSFVAEMDSSALGDDISLHLKAAEEFKYSNLADEMNIGGVYVRLFNEMDVKEAVRAIPSTKRYAQSLIRLVGRSFLNDKGMSEVIEKSYVESATVDRNEVTIDIDKESMWCPVNDDRFYMCVSALLRLSKIDGLVDDVLCEVNAAGILMSLVTVDYDNKSFPVGLELLSQIGTKQAFTNALVKRGVIPWYLSRLIFHFEDHVNGTNLKEDPRWFILESLASSSPIALSLVESSGWIELLSVVSGCSQFSKVRAARLGAARVLAILLHDPQVSTTTASLLQQLIPLALVALLKDDGADALLLAFDKDSGTPELIWDASMRTELQHRTSSFIYKLFDSNNKRIVKSTSFALPTEFLFKYRKTENEMCIGGIYVRLYLEDPSFPLRDYNGFLQALLERWLEEMELLTEKQIVTSAQNFSPILGIEQKTIEVVTNAVICTCDIRPFLLEKLCGYTKHVVKFMMKAKAMNLIEMPLLSTFRLIRLLSSELLTVEDLVTFVDREGKSGIVAATMAAIDGNPLHSDSALMVEALKLVFYTALGDVESCSMLSGASNPVIDTTFMAYALAPSPAPGTDSVKKMKEASPDHPLAMMFDDAAPSLPKSSRAIRPKNKQPGRRQIRSSISNQASGEQRSKFSANQAMRSNTHKNPQMSNTEFKIQYSIQNSSLQVPGVMSTSHGDEGVQVSGKMHTSPRVGNQPQPMLRNSVPIEENSFPVSHNTHANASPTIPYTQRTTSNGNFLGGNNPRTPLAHSSQGSRVYHTIQSPPMTKSLPPSSPQPNTGVNTHYLQKHITNLNESPLLSSIQAPPILGIDNNVHPSQYTAAAAQHSQNRPSPLIDSHSSIPLIPADNQSTPTSQSHQQYPPPFAITEAPTVTHSPPTPAMIANERMKSAEGAPNSAKGRRILMDSALSCGLPQFLVNSVLENQNLNSVKDATATKAHSLELLHLMLKDPGYGLKFELVLDAIPNGEKYKIKTGEKKSL